MADQDTAIKGDPAVAVAPDASATSSKAGSDSTQPAKPAVDAETAEVKGKTAQSDDGDGADSGDGVRQRPGRAERKIGELTAKIKELEDAQAQTADLGSRLTATPVDASSVNLPDYSQMTEITPDQLKKDIITAASQIVDLKMQTTANVLEQNITARETREKNAQAIQNAIKKYPILNPDSEDFDAEFEQDLTSSFVDILQKNPSASFSTFIKPMERFLGQSNTTDATSSESRPRGTTANRATTATRRNSGAFPENGTLLEQEAWFAARRG